MTYTKQEYDQREIYNIWRNLYISITINHNNSCLAGTEVGNMKSAIYTHVFLSDCVVTASASSG